MIKAMLFDLGNTLIEYPSPEKLRENYIKNAHNQTHFVDQELLDRMHELLMEDRRAGFKTFREATIERALSRALCERGDCVGAGYVLDRVNEIYHYGFSVPATLIDGARELLARLEARGIKMGIVSNTPFPGHLFRDEMVRFGIGRYFQTFVWSSEFGKRKPSPDIFMEALNNLGIDPRDAAFVGDKLDRDVAGSRGVGMTPIWFDRKGTVVNYEGYRVTSLSQIPHLEGLF